MDSRISLYKLSVEERRKKIKDFANLTDEEISYYDGKFLNVADKMIENVIGVYEMPIGIAANFLINNKDYLIPMCIEEPSVVAAASNAAKIARIRGGFKTYSTDPIMIGQVQVTNLENLDIAEIEILKQKKELIDLVNSKDPLLIKFGGGCKDIITRKIYGNFGNYLVLHLLVDCRDAMGANAVNTMCETIKDKVEEITKGKVILRIVSNLAIYRKSYAYAVFDKDEIGKENVDKILMAYDLAVNDVFRCATHNKGIMNGIDALMLATGNDFRAVEAGAHAFASLNGYKPLTSYSKDKEGNLVGKIELPMPVGIIGGATKVHPIVKTNLKILNVKSAKELGEVAAALGLAQNFAALRALATEGIQRGHMSLHARNVAISAGVPVEYADEVAKIMVEDKKINMDYAKEVYERIKEKEKGNL